RQPVGHLAPARGHVAHRSSPPCADEARGRRDDGVRGLGDPRRVEVTGHRREQLPPVEEEGVDEDRRHAPARGGRRPDRCEPLVQDRKSTRLNSSHSQISYAVFCLKKKKNHRTTNTLSLHRACPPRTHPDLSPTPPHP